MVYSKRDLPLPGDREADDTYWAIGGTAVDTAAMRLAAKKTFNDYMPRPTTGDDAVAVNNGGEFRFVEGTPRGDVIPEADRATAPEFGGTLLDGEPFSSGELVQAVDDAITHEPPRSTARRFAGAGRGSSQEAHA